MQVSLRSIRSDCFRRAVQAHDRFGSNAVPPASATHLHNQTAASKQQELDADDGWDIEAETRRLERSDCVEVRGTRRRAGDWRPIPMRYAAVCVGLFGR